ncbi:hypothetical protein QL285_097524 [Trifolium repens]|jgi:hypothetical protein|nr:hypothetical protein QL285_098265 [Trifolium repens]KAK2351127.1 hypothetical protein QL285_097524 [Trifolium repens]
MGARRPEAEDQSTGIALNSSRNAHSNDSLNGSRNKTYPRLILFSLYEWKDREKSIDSFPVPPLAFILYKKPEGTREEQ